MSEVTNPNRTQVIFYKGAPPKSQAKQHISPERDRERTELIKKLNQDTQGSIHALCKNPDIPEYVRPDLIISDKPAPPVSNRNYSLPRIEIKFPQIDSNIASALTFTPRLEKQETSPSKQAHSWYITISREEKPPKKSGEESEPTEPDTPNESTIHGFTCSVSNTFNSEINPVVTRDLSEKDLLRTVTNYLDQLIMCGGFPLDQTAKTIFGEERFKDNNFTQRIHETANSTDKELKVIYEILNKFFNQDYSISQLSTEYPQYSIIKLVKFINNATKSTDAISSLTVEDHTWNSSAYTQVLVDLSGKDLENFEAAIQEIKSEQPGLLKNTEFTIVSNLPATTESPLCSDAAGYVHSLFEEAQQKRNNLLLIGNPYTDYLKAMCAIPSAGAGANLTAGFVGLVKIWGEADQIKLHELGGIKTNSDHPLNLVNVATDINSMLDIPIMDKLDAATKGSILDIPAKNQNDLKTSLIKILKSRSGENEILEHEISDLVPRKDEKWAKFTGTTALDLVRHENKTETCNANINVVYKDLLKIMTDFSRTNGLSKIQKEKIQTFIKQIESTITQGKMGKPERAEYLKELKSRIATALPMLKKPKQEDLIQTEQAEPVDTPIPEILLSNLERIQRITWPLILANLGKQFQDKPSEPEEKTPSPLLTALREDLRKFLARKTTINLMQQLNSPDTDPGFTNHAAALLRGEEYSHEEYFPNLELEIQSLRGSTIETVNYNTNSPLEYHSSNPDLNFIIALRILMAFKNAADKIWIGTTDEQRKIPPAGMIEAAAKALQTLGMINYEDTNQPPQVIPPEVSVTTDDRQKAVA